MYKRANEPLTRTNFSWKNQQYLMKTKYQVENGANDSRT